MFVTPVTLTRSNLETQHSQQCINVESALGAAMTDVSISKI